MQTSVAEPTAVRTKTLFDRIFVLVDCSKASQQAVVVALELQRAYDSTVSLFHLAQSSGSDDWLGGIGSPAVGGDWVAETQGRLRRFLENIAPGQAERVEVHARVGENIHTVRRAAEDWDATLFVAALGVHPKLFRSPAERLIHDFDVPVLLIPT